MNVILIYFAIKYNGDWDRIYEALEAKERVSLGELKKTEKAVLDSGADIITIIDNDYPEELKSTYKPAFVIDRKLGYKLNGANQARLHKDTFNNKEFNELRKNSISADDASKLMN